MVGDGEAAVKAAPLRRPGIRTSYTGIMFRSRHEAIWAATFDKLRLAWGYEPCDLSGYIPDFDLRFAKRPLLVEIKSSDEDFECAKSKFELSGWDGHAAILTTGASKNVGIMTDGEIWDTCVVAWCFACERTTLVQECGDWTCRNCNAGSRSLWFAYDIRKEWCEAQNEMQWRAA
jgi:hypothetical protein